MADVLVSDVRYYDSRRAVLEDWEAVGRWVDEHDLAFVPGTPRDDRIEFVFDLVDSAHFEIIRLPGGDVEVELVRLGA